MVPYDDIINSQKQAQISYAKLWPLDAKHLATRMWANAQPDGRPAKHRWRPLFNAAKFG